MRHHQKLDISEDAVALLTLQELGYWHSDNKTILHFNDAFLCENFLNDNYHS